MKKYIVFLITLVVSILSIKADQASCSGNDGVSYVTVTTESAPSPGTNFIVKGYGQYTNATCFVTYNETGSNKEYSLTINIRDGQGKGYTSCPEYKVCNLKVEVASFCR